jgi:hypothetical protein
MSMCGMPACKHCGKPVQTVWGSADWHKANDPFGGYCQCVNNEFRQLAEAAKSKIESDNYQKMIAACEAYLTPKGNMQSREDFVVRMFARRSEYEQVCNANSVLSALKELDRLRAENAAQALLIASLKEDVAKWKVQAQALWSMALILETEIKDESKNALFRSGVQVSIAKLKTTAQMLMDFQEDYKWNAENATEQLPK